MRATSWLSMTKLSAIFKTEIRLQMIHCGCKIFWKKWKAGKVKEKLSSSPTIDVSSMPTSLTSVT